MPNPYWLPACVLCPKAVADPTGSCFGCTALCCLLRCQGDSSPLAAASAVRQAFHTTAAASPAQVKLNAIVGFFPANAVGDDIEVYTDETRTQVATKFFGLRQQAEKDNEEPYHCVSDFVAPKGSGINDYIGMFACTAGIGLEEVVHKYKEAGDDYSYIMAEALADRLAEALAEKLHEIVRKEDWGYALGENMSVEDMLKVKYQVRGVLPQGTG